MSSNIKHIAYYTRKLVQHTQLRRPWPHRINRLLAYKAALNKRLYAERLTWKPAINISEVAMDEN